MADATPVLGDVLRTKEFLGRDVLDASGSKVGTVGDLLVDRRNGRIRFLDLNLGVLRKQHVLVPVDQLEWGARDFVLGRWTGADVKALPAYDPDRPLTGEVLEELGRSHPRFYGDVDAPPAAPGDRRVLPMKDAKGLQALGRRPGTCAAGTSSAPTASASARSPKCWSTPGELKIRYLDVDILDDLFLLEDDRHVLVPLEMVELKERGKDVWVARLRAEEVARLPAYVGGAVDPLIEERVHRAFTPTHTGAE